MGGIAGSSVVVGLRASMIAASSAAVAGGMAVRATKRVWTRSRAGSHRCGRMDGQTRA